ncbi:hypothetical protein [Roseinatronobacter alkalisoli]|uniref:Uncharacterized protein n=1 Tax=Roseinatronobacter alkalisoli TaxID=3028235 RepID=A0ABT5TAD5_9RHOB|nr:hypothetical protein [Roseinatronobacter sp. HJB301]MDD7972082.1 hypothetical protein [Roseinatronobacter sp. HJB301]
MSVLTAIPASGPVSPGHREPLGQLLQPHPSRGVAAVGKSITAGAVQQTQSLTKSGMTATRPPASPQDKRHRLVGPPPSFEVNVIQHLRETRTEMPVTDDGPNPVSIPAARLDSQDQNRAYGALAGIGSDADSEAATHMDISI